MTMQLIETIELTAPATSVTFTGIPSDGKDLLCLFSYDGTANGSFNFRVRLNNSNNVVRYHWGNGVNKSAGDTDGVGIVDSDYPTASTFHQLQVYVPQYATTGAKVWNSELVVEANNTSAFASWQQLTTGTSASTAPVSTLQFIPDYLQFSTYTKASLYKIL